MDSWKQDEKTMTKYFIKASNVQFLSSGKKDEPAQGGNAEQKIQPTEKSAPNQNLNEDIPF
jgi:hypothetical protein